MFFPRIFTYVFAHLFVCVCPLSSLALFSVSLPSLLPLLSCSGSIFLFAHLLCLHHTPFPVCLVSLLSRFISLSVCLSSCSRFRCLCCLSSLSLPFRLFFTSCSLFQVFAPYFLPFVYVSSRNACKSPVGCTKAVRLCF